MLIIFTNVLCIFNIIVLKKQEFGLKLLLMGPMWPLTPRFLHTANAANQQLAPDYYFCFLQDGTSVSTITTRNNEVIKSIFSANVYHVPGLWLLGIGGATYISHKIMAQKTYFHILISLKTI